MIIDPLDGNLSPEGSAVLHFRRMSPSASTGRISCKVCLLFLFMIAKRKTVKSYQTKFVVVICSMVDNLRCFCRSIIVKKMKYACTNPFYLRSLSKRKFPILPQQKLHYLMISSPKFQQTVYSYQLLRDSDIIGKNPS